MKLKKKTKVMLPSIIRGIAILAISSLLLDQTILNLNSIQATLVRLNSTSNSAVRLPKNQPQTSSIISDNQYKSKQSKQLLPIDAFNNKKFQDNLLNSKNQTIVEKICIGTSNRLSAQYNKTDHYHNLVERYKNCTYVMGNLELTWLNNNNQRDLIDLSFLESIREITGYLLIAYVEVDKIRMPNLQIIRGRDLYKNTNNIQDHHRTIDDIDNDKGGEQEEFAIYLYENKLKTLELPNLREILAGSVKFYNNNYLCHIRTINWDEILWPSYKSIFVYNQYQATEPQAESCPPCDSSCQGSCWAPGPEMCQKFSKTNCSPQCSLGAGLAGAGPAQLVAQNSLIAASVAAGGGVGAAGVGGSSSTAGSSLVNSIAISPMSILMMNNNHQIKKSSTSTRNGVVIVGGAGTTSSGSNLHHHHHHHHHQTTLLTGRCFGPSAAECCHPFCAGGCTGPKQTDCLACKNFYDDGECIHECPSMERYNPTKFLWETNPNGKFAFGAKCVKDCPKHLLRDNGACVRTCPPNKRSKDGECITCGGPCPKSCQGVEVVHSGNIDQLINCTVIEGSITISDLSFTGYAEPSSASSSSSSLLSSSSSSSSSSLSNSNINANVTRYKPMHPNRLEVFKTLREITGYLNIQANHPDFKNLSYFRNLKTIGGGQTTDMFYGLSITKTSLVSLNLISLRKVKSGRIIIEDNKNLCYADLIDWSQLNITSKKDDVIIRNNADSNKCRQLNLQCHQQCAKDGCWGAGPDECLSCNNYKLDDYCVDNCNSTTTTTTTVGSGDNEEELVLLSYDSGNRTCKKCHPECREGCSGSEAKNCFKCKNVKDGPYCVPECPNHKYNKNGTCEECDKSCTNGCTGPSNRLGEGGCNSCGKAIIGLTNSQGSASSSAQTEVSSGANGNLATSSGTPSTSLYLGQQYIATVSHCIRAEDPCPEGYYQEYISPQAVQHHQHNHHHHQQQQQQQVSLKALLGKPVCRKCHHRCKSCSGMGTHVSVCECAKYVAGEQCEDYCPRDYFPDDSLGKCIKCSQECNGCFGPTEADCISCRVYRIYYESPSSSLAAGTLSTATGQHEQISDRFNQLQQQQQQEGATNSQQVGTGNIKSQIKFNCTAQCPSDKPHRISESNMLDPYCSEDPGVDIENPRIVSLSTSTSILFVSIISILLTIFALFVYRCQIEKDKTVKLTMHLSGIDDVEPLTPSNLKPNLAPLRSIKETELRKGNILGSGFGGTVYQGFWYPEEGSDDKKPRPVAIKVLRDNGQSNMNKEFLDEAYIMASVNHPNLVRLLAVCMTPNHLMLVTQLMPLGCLLEHVKKYKNEIGSKNLLEWCKQIAKGMAYLEEHRMVHRDLALRNVLLQTCGRALISDFGLAKFLELDQSEYSHSGGGRLPIKWLAPECIKERKFTHKSDVWAFGVTIWELLTFGQRPFEEYETRDVPLAIEKGARLKQPSYMSAEVYKVMYECWFYSPEARPNFSKLTQSFVKFARDPGRYLICRTKGIEYTKQVYYNTTSKTKDQHCLSKSSQDSCDEYNSDLDTFNSCTEEEPMSAGMPDLTPSTHNRINEIRFGFELSRQQQQQQHNLEQLSPEVQQQLSDSPTIKKFSNMFQSHLNQHSHLHHHHLHHEQQQEQEDNEEVFTSSPPATTNTNQRHQHKAKQMITTDANNNVTFINPTTQQAIRFSGSGCWPVHHSMSTNSLGQRSEQPTDMYDYLVPSPIVDEHSNFSTFYGSSYNSRSTNSNTATSTMMTTNIKSENSQQNRKQQQNNRPPHSAGLVGVTNEEYFLTSVNESKNKKQHQFRTLSTSYDEPDIVASSDLTSRGNTNNPSSSSQLSSALSSNNLNLISHQQLQKARKLSTSNGNIPHSLV